MSLTPDRILQVGLGFWQSKALLTAVRFGVFTELARGPRTGAELQAACGWHPRGVHDLLDGLVAMRFLEREGSGVDALYANTRETAAFLDRSGAGYVGGILEMANDRLFRFWADLDEAMRTGQPQNEIKRAGESIFAELYKEPEKLRQFMGAMAGFSRGNFEALAERFDFGRYTSVCDVGGATGLLSCCIVKRHPDVRCVTFDLPPVAPIAQELIEAEGLAHRVRTASGDFFADPLPRADAITMGMVLHDWNLERKMHLIRAAYDALPSGGALIVVETLIDDDRRENIMGLMNSLNMLIEFGEAFDYSGADFRGWCEEVGFRRFEVMRLRGPSSAAVAYK